jgi:hypothetical protein
MKVAFTIIIEVEREDDFDNFEEFDHQMNTLLSAF